MFYAPTGLERVADLNVRPPHTLRTPPTTPRSKPGNISPERVEVDYWDSPKGSDTATCASSIMLRNERVEDVEEEVRRRQSNPNRACG